MSDLIPVPMSLVSLQMQEPTCLPLRFQPGWHNVWEASLFKKANRVTGTHEWLFSRFGGDNAPSPRKTHLRDCTEAFTRTCEQALTLPLAQKRLRLRGAKNAMIFFDSWGESSCFEGIDNWRDTMFLDILPKKIALEYKLQAFSGKLRGERTGFLQALEMAQDCLQSGVADNVVVCGQHRHFPVLAFSEAAGWPKGQKRYQSDINVVHAVERNVCLLLTRQLPLLPALCLSPRLALPLKEKAAAAAVSGHWQAANSLQIFSCAPPAPALLAINRRAAAHFPAHLSLYTHFGDSGSLNPALGIYHWYNAGAPQGSALVSSLQQGHYLWLLHCQPGTAKTQEKTGVDRKDNSLREEINLL